MFTPLSTLHAVPRTVQGTDYVDFSLIPGHLTGPDLPVVASAMQQMVLDPSLEQQGATTTTSIPATLGAVRASWRAVEVPVVLISAQLLILAWLLLFLLVADAAAPDTGQVLVDGRPVHPGQIPPGVATMLQGHGLVSLLTATENIEITLFTAGMPAGRATATAQDALAAVGLAEHTGQLADELSGGQQQRVAVARALASQPTVLLADEPTAEQDSTSRELVLERMLQITADGGTLVLATHDPEIAQRCDRVPDLSQLRTEPLSDPGLAPR